MPVDTSAPHTDTLDPPSPAPRHTGHGNRAGARRHAALDPATLSVLVQAALSVGERLMDAVDPALVDTAEHVVAAVDGVVEVGDLRVRWIGHRLHADVRITVDRDLGVAAAYDIAESVYHDPLHHVPRLTGAVVHTDPCGHDGSDPHVHTAHHAPAS